MWPEMLDEWGRSAMSSLVAAHARVVAYDRAGIGDSDPLVPLTLDAQLADLEAVARETSGGKPIVISGHSWGGLLAQPPGHSGVPQLIEMSWRRCVGEQVPVAPDHIDYREPDGVGPVCSKMRSWVITQ